MLWRYVLVWFALALVAMVNGMIREYTYGRAMSDLGAHQVSTATAVLLSGFLVWLISRRWPIESPGQAWLIGAIWLAMTVAFEFGFGHYVAGHEWTRLLADYNLLEGRVWSLFLGWIFVLPYVSYRL